MKRTLLSAALLAGLVSAANAQSSVTLFGIVDATLTRGTGSTASRTQLTRGGLQSNRLGFRGTEDLGGGLSVNFWLEAGFNIDDGTGLATNTNNQTTGAAAAAGGSQGLTFGRRATVSLASATLGELRFGRDYVPHYWNLYYADPFLNAGAGIGLNYQGAANLVGGLTNVRASNIVSYFTPNTLNGFSAQVSAYQGENASNAVNSKDGNGYGLRVGYDKGPLAAGIAYGHTNYRTGDINQWNLFGSYNFGAVRPVFGYNQDKVGAVQGKGWVVGAFIPVGAGEIKFAYSRYETNAAGHPTVSKPAIGYVYYMSKRTALYATLAQVSNKGGSSMALNGAVTAPNTTSRGFDLGIRHSF